MSANTDHIKQIWEEQAPREMRVFMGLLLDPKNKDIDGAEIIVALKWVLRNLDEEWQLVASDLITKKKLGDSNLLTEVEQRKWKNLVRLWVGLPYWRRSQPPEKTSTGNEDINSQSLEYFVKLSEYLDVSTFPLGASKAEHDPLFLTTRCDAPSNFRDYEKDVPCFILGRSGVGKTGAALWLGYHGLQRAGDKRIFPVYFRFSKIPSLLEMMPIWASSVLSYIAMDPASYLDRNIAGRAAIAHLLLKYGIKNSNLELAFYEAGLPRTGLGTKLKEDIKRFAESSALTELDEEGIISIVGEFYPHNFNMTTLYLDLNLQRMPDKKEKIYLSELMMKLQDWGIVVKIFTNIDFPKGIKSNFPTFEIKWKKDELKEILRRRLSRIYPPELVAWCDPAARMTSPEDRIIAASNGTPAGVIEKLNMLFKKITLTHPSLSSQDLDEVLGPVSTRTRRKS